MRVYHRLTYTLAFNVWVSSTAPHKKVSNFRRLQG